MSSHPAYREVQVYRALWWVLPLTGLVSAAAVAADPKPGAWVGATIAAVSLVGLLLCLGRLVIEVHGDAIRWSFGYLGWPRWSVALDQVTQVQAVRATSAWSSGIRGPSRSREYTVKIGGPGIRLFVNDGRSITLGTADPQRLIGFVEARLSPPDRARRHAHPR